ncbi:hypothetical protein Q3C01_09995 [Bradyrhizobium sp. UFLA05-109]
MKQECSVEFRVWVRSCSRWVLAMMVMEGGIWLWRLRELPREPSMGNDSAGYLAGADYRPHGYTLFLDAYRAIVGDLSYLPHFQLLLLFLSHFLLALVIGWRARSVVAAWIVLGAASLARPFSNVVQVMSDPLYEASLISGIALLIMYGARNRLLFLVGSASLLGLACITRTIGLAIVPAVVVFLLIQLKRVGFSSTRRVFLAFVLPVAFCAVVAASSNELRNGQFRIGSWGGMSLLGRGLVVAKPVQPSDESTAWIAEEVAPVRQALDRIHDPILKMLVVRQYYECLRWFVFWQEFDEKLPGWEPASDYQKGKLAGALAGSFIKNDPWEYLSLSALDYTALWLMPRILTPSEQESLEASYRSLGPLPYLSAFERSEMGADEYFHVIPEPRAAVKVWIVRCFSISFLLGNALMLVMLCRNPRRWMRAKGGPEALLMAGCVHLSYLATATVESGLERYIAPTWPLLLATTACVIAAISPQANRVTAAR